MVAPLVSRLLWPYGEALSPALIKYQPEDFVVEENLAIQTDEAGRHRLLRIEKRNTNTQWLQRQLADFANVKPVDVGYCGLKDRRAVTSQWFSVNMQGREEPDWSRFDTADYRILRIESQHKKLKKGIHQSNSFRLHLRQLGEVNRVLVEARLTLIAEQGFANYFGTQRFGHNGENLQRFLQSKHLRGAKASLLISAARSFLFNEMLSQRIGQMGWHSICPGDCMMLNNSRSIFTVDEVDASLQQRFLEGDIHPTAAMWGKGELSCRYEVAQMETSVAQAHPQMIKQLLRSGSNMARRAVRVIPEMLSWQWLDQDLLLETRLPAGAYATVLLQHLFEISSGEDAQGLD